MEKALKDTLTRAQRWGAEQFNLPVDDVIIAELVDLFPAATGRDIKGLTKLVAKFCHQLRQDPTIEAFRRCSIFRGMDLSGR
jgi:hypothetical protein